ncbi:MAG: NUDIX domain-containing protein [Bacteroidetes bacterium]|nr:NUDIX domain-containing protein [Bacteroidota bacterium]
MYKKPNAYCSYCGTQFSETEDFPKTCTHCENTTYLNPTVVAVVALPVDDGILVIRRGEPAGEGELAFPGGFIESGESWEAGAARELWEETHVKISPDDITHFATRSIPNGKIILIFGLAKPMREKDLPPFTPTNETTERLVLREYEDLAFPIHSQVLRQFF